MSTKIKYTVLLLFLIVSAGCGVQAIEEIETPISRDLTEALLPLTSSSCEWNADGKYAEQFTSQDGESSEGFWASGGGCVQRSIRETWALLHNFKLMQWESVHEHSAAKVNPPSNDISHYYEVKYIVRDTITVDWTMAWLHSVQWGSLEDPGQVLVNYQKIRGTSHISKWEGSILLEAVDPEVTSVTIKNEIKGSSLSGIGKKDAVGAVTDIFEKLRKSGEKFNDKKEPNWEAVGGKALWIGASK